MEETKTTKRGRTYVAIILDRSGSMATVKNETVKGYNEQVKVLLEEAAKPDHSETFASLITFNDRVAEEFFNAPIEILREMHESQYNPTGWTAMYDGVGYTINKLCETTDILDDFNSYLIVVISDGKDTGHSRVWNEKSVAEKVKQLQDTNRWTFTYIGSNQDLSKIREGLRFANTMSYDSSKGGTSQMFLSNARQMKKWFKKRDTSLESGNKGFSDNDYFEGASDASELDKKDA